MVLLTSLISPELVGRAEELHAGGRALAEASQRRGSMLVITGDPGIGKSRLARELATAAEIADFYVLRGTSFEQDRSLAYGPLLDALQSFALSTPDASPALDRLPAEIRDEVEGRPSSVAAPGPGDHARRRLYEGLHAFLSQLAVERPVFLLLDDVQWADDSTLDWLAYIAPRVRNERILAVLTCRTSEIELRPDLRARLTDLERQRLAAVLRLAPLAESAMEEMVAAIFENADEADPALVRFLYRRSEGNPFFAEELLRALADERCLSPDGRLLREPATALPESVREIILRRLDALAEDGREVLAAAAVIGRRFDVAILERMVALDEPRLLAAIRELVRHHLLTQEPGGAEILRFRHGLVQEVAYAGLLGPERRRLHALAAETMERGELGGEGHAADLAYHWREARQPDRARTAAVRAGQAAERVFAWSEAASFYSEAASDWPATDPGGKADVLFRLGLVTFNDGDLRAAHRAWSVCTELAAAAASARLQGEAERRIARIYWLQADREEALRHLRRSLSLLDQVGPSIERAAAYEAMALMHLAASEYRPATEWASRAKALAEELGAGEVEAGAVNVLGCCLFSEGLFDGGERLIWRSIELAQEVNSAEEIARGYANLLDCLHLRGVRRREFERILGVALREAERRGLGERRLQLLAFAARSVSVFGDFERAESMLRQVTGAEDRLSTASSFDSELALARLAFFRGDWEGAAERLGALSRPLERSTELQVLAPAGVAAAAALRMQGRWDEAASALEPALAAWRRLRDLLTAPDILLEHVRHLVHLRHGDAAYAARDELAALVRVGPFPLGEAALEAADAVLDRADGDFEGAAGHFDAAASVLRSVDHVVTAALLDVEVGLMGLARRSAPDRARGLDALNAARRVLDPLGSRFVDRAAQASGLVERAAGPDLSELAPLTSREREILAALAKGRSNAEIAGELVLSERTVERHLSNIYAKLDLQNRSAAVAFAARLLPAE